ncbi:MAG: hypothetical protein ACSHYB_19170 [Roseibacillus sp.]
MSLLPSSLSAQKEPPTIADIAPQVDDITSMWWKDGFPTRVTGAPWLRRVQTGTYAFELNTETLAITHLGPLPTDYPIGSQDVWKELTPATLDLQINVDGENYHCQSGGKWTRLTGPRLIESGRYVQRADVTDLTFVSKDGTILAFDTRFETIAWPDRLGLIFHARPHQNKKPLIDGKTVSLKIAIQQGNKRWLKSETLKNNTDNPLNQWSQVYLNLDPQNSTQVPPHCPLKVEARSAAGESHSVTYDSPLIRHRINLDPPIPKRPRKSNDAVERVTLTLTNPTDTPQTARLCFEKTSAGFEAFEGSPITGVSAILCDKQGNPCGIPIQLSKNWHHSPEKPVYSGTWLHASTLLRLPPDSTTELQLVIVCGHWGGLPAASHAQLSLIGWGSNQLWEQSALGAWGESICYEPDQAQAGTTITDVRPLMVTSDRKRLWKWTANVGGADFYRLFDKEENRVPPHTMKAIYHRTGPCLTEVTYQGLLGTGIKHETTVSIARTDDLVRATYQLSMQVTEDTDFSRLVLFQVGADTYNTTREKKFAVGSNLNLSQEWSATWGDNVYQSSPIQLLGSNPWVSFHEGEKIGQEDKGPGANRGFVIRKWKAQLGGKKAQPWVRERGIGRNNRESSIIDLLPPPEVTSLKSGDYLEATIEHLVIPQSPEVYYGPNKELRAALTQYADTWRMVSREAKGNSRDLKVEKGTLLGKFPDIRIASDNNQACFNLTNGLGFVPITFTNLSSHKGYQILIDSEIWQQTANKNDYWQSDYHPKTKTWSQTYNIPFPSGKTTQVKFRPAE